MAAQHFFIFSYGSNLLLQRIRERVASVEVVSTHELAGYRLLFNKQSVDGSTKANIGVAPNQKTAVWGVIHRVTQEDKPTLDRYEALGQGYLEMHFNLTIQGESKSVQAYVATESQYLSEGAPYEWYLNFIIEGAIENDFPEDYIKKLKAIESKVDLHRARRQENQMLLERAQKNNNKIT